jgi:23S rRNA (uracil1939-C5)-methyltransferase
VGETKRVTVERAARHEHVGAGRSSMRDGVGADAAINLDIDVVAAGVGHGPYLGDLGRHGRNVGLTAEAGVHRHHQHQINQVEHMGHGRRRRRRIEGDRRLDAERANVAEGAMQMLAGFGVHDEPLATSVDVTGRQFVRGEHHEVRLERKLGVLSAGRDEVGPERQIRNKLAVHDVPLDAIGASRFQRGHFLAHASPIGRENRRGEVNWSSRGGGHGRHGNDGTRPVRSRPVTTVDFTLTGVVAGGDAIAREASGRVVFVRGGLPGEQVRAKIIEQKKDFARADVVEVVSASSHRTSLPCVHARAGCGGCGWMHSSVEGQREMKQQIVLDALRRTGGVAEPMVEMGPTLPSEGFRTSLRMVVTGDRLAFRRARSHDTVVIDNCMVAHPLLQEIIAEGRFPKADEVSLRVGVASGERTVLIDPRPIFRDGFLPAGVASGPKAMVHEVVAGRTFQITSTSFFQTRTDGAAALVDAVSQAAGSLVGKTFIDAYGGVGLFASALGADASVISIEESPSSSLDARANLADRDAELVCSSIERWQPQPADVVIADPSRRGLGAPAVDVLVRCNAERLVLVSCDPVAMARDTKLLAARGYALATATMIDLFPHTPHVEVVARFDRR